VIKIPLYLDIAQWALLGGLGVLVVVLFRQLGTLLAGSARSAPLGPPLGSRAARLSYIGIGPDPGETRRWLTPGDGTAVLLAFVDPTCPSCEELLRVLDELLAAGELAGLRVLALISDPPSYVRISAAFTASRIEIGRPAEPGGLDAYRVSGTPLLVAIDAVGLVSAAGSVLEIAQVRAYAQACLLRQAAPVSSLVVQPAARVGEGAGDEPWQGDVLPRWRARDAGRAGRAAAEPQGRAAPGDHRRHHRAGRVGDGRESGAGVGLRLRPNPPLLGLP